jgi:type III secretion protein V
MPGKQMAIDADLRNGGISGAEAKIRRRQLELESQFYGAMDGAMKFVKGDAIAGLIIVLLNLVVGIVIGTMSKGMELSHAADVYSVLSIGDALTSQLPSLLTSIASGFVATRVAAVTGRERSLGTSIVDQLLAQPRALMVSAALILLLAFVPGFPAPYFLLVGVALLVVRLITVPFGNRMVRVENIPLPALAREGSTEVPNFVSDTVSDIVDPISVVISRRLLVTLRPNRFNAKLRACRMALLSELGIPFPGAHISVGEQYGDNAFSVFVYEVPFFSLSWRQGYWLCRSTDAGAASESSHVHIPELGSMYWLPAEDSLPESASGGIACEELLAHIVITAVRENVGRLLGMSEAKYILEAADVHLGGLARQLTDIVPVQLISEVFRRLLQEGISIRNMRSICDSLMAWGSREKDSGLLTEYVRCDLGEYVTFKASRGLAELNAAVLDAKVEQTIRSAIQHSPSGAYMTLSPERISEFEAAIVRVLREAGDGLPMAIICSMDIRRFVRKMIGRAHTAVSVLSYQELRDNVKLKHTGRISVDSWQ